MKKTTRSRGLVIIGLLSLALSGCATAGRHYDDNKVAMIQKDVTTESQLLEWFGPPIERSLNGDGTRRMTWTFASTKVGSAHSAGHLQVQLDAEGKVKVYSASAGR